MSSLSTRFLSFEAEHDVFSLTVRDVRVWERIRHLVYGSVLNQKDRSTSPSLIQRTTIRKGVSALRNLVNKNPYLSIQRDLMFIGHRRTLEADGYWWDHILDPFHVQSTYDYVHFEKPQWSANGNHDSPARTENLRYLDLIEHGGAVRMPVERSRERLPSSAREELVDIRNKLHERFGVSPDVPLMVENHFANRRSRRWMYKKLFDRVAPNMVIGTGNLINYINILEIAKERNIPIVYVQHGAVSPNMVNHTYPDGVDPELYPDYYFAWGEFWKEQGSFPLPSDRVVPIGYPFLEHRADSPATDRSQRQAVFISQGTIGDELSKFAVEFDDTYRYETVYKLHPSEYDDWEERYPWLVDSEIRVVDSDTPSLYEIFQNSSLQIGVYSTAIYEGLEFGLKTYLLNSYGIQKMDRLVAEDLATVIEDVEEIEISEERPNLDTEFLFESNSVENFNNAIESILES